MLLLKFLKVITLLSHLNTSNIADAFKQLDAFTKFINGTAINPLPKRVKIATPAIFHVKMGQPLKMDYLIPWLVSLIPDWVNDRGAVLLYRT